MSKIKNLPYIALLYALSIGFSALAQSSLLGYSLNIFWIAFLPIATHTSVLTIDILCDLFDFQKDFKDNKGAILVLSGLIAVALAIFLR